MSRQKIVFLTVLVVSRMASAAHIDTEPDVVLAYGKIVTVDPEFSIVEAVAIKNGRFIGLGDNTELLALANEHTEIVELNGMTVVPGFIDGHAHMDREGLKFIYPSLAGARSIDDVLQVVEREVAMRAPGDWVVTMPLGEYPYYESGPDLLSDGRYPDRWDLDRVAPNNPVYIRGIWYSWRGSPPIVSIANSRALELAGIDEETVAPHPGLEIVKDAQTGEPTGVFIEQGTLPTIEYSLMSVAPRFTDEQRFNALTVSMQRYNAVGITGIYEGHGISSVVLKAYKRLWERDEMTVRSALVISPAWSVAPVAPIADILQEWIAFAGGAGIGDSMLKLNGIYAEVGTSPQIEIRIRERPYPGWAGYGVDQVLPPSRGSLYDLVLAAAQANLRVNGDADQLVRYLDVMERVNDIVPISERRFVLMHVDFAAEAQLALIKELGIVPTIITTRLWRDGSIRTRNASSERLSTYVPLKSYVENEIPFVLVTDNSPIEPLHALWAAVARQDLSTGEVIVADQKISREDALRAFTVNGAYLSFAENERGSIELGKLADLVVLSDDILTVPEERIREIDVVMTMVGGNVVYRSSSAPGLN